MNESKGMESLPCVLGCIDDDVLLFTGRDRIQELPGKFDVVKCRACGLLRTNPRPTSDSLGFYYPSDYGPYTSTKVVPERDQVSNGIKGYLRPIVRRLFDTRSNALPKLVPGKLLEIGCASGSFLHSMESKGWTVQGVEFSDDAASSARQLGHAVYSGSLDNMPRPMLPYDLVVGWMVLEHLGNPLESLKKLNEWSSPDAWLVFSVPDAGSLGLKIFSDKWYDLHLPNHLYHFSKKTIESLCKVAEWEVVKVYHQRSVNSLLMSVAYTLEEKRCMFLGKIFRQWSSASGVWFYVKYPAAWILGVLGQSGRMTVWARKA